MAAPPAPPPAAAPAGRLASLDALRGFDMLWITGLGGVAGALVSAGVLPKWVSEQLQHVAWEGFRFEDLIMPLFVFITGATIPFSVLPRAQRGDPHGRLLLHLARRALLLLLLGAVYNGALRLEGVAGTRFASVLGFIGFSWFFAALIALHSGIRTQVAWAAGLLLGYAAAMRWVAVPGFGAGVMTPAGAIGAWVDRLLLPGQLYGGTYDPQGILPSIAGIPTALFGAWAGQWLKSERHSGHRKALGLLGAGLAALIAGRLGAGLVPIIKNQWSSTFVLFAAGWSLLLLAAFYWLIDVRGWRAPALPFVVVGMNPIAIYLLVKLVNFGGPSQFLFGGAARLAGKPWDSVILATGALALEWLLLWFLWRRRIFFKL